MPGECDHLPVVRWLEIGPGPQRLTGPWTTVDCRPRRDIVDCVCRWGDEPLPFADGTFDLVYASHVLEHIPWFRTVAALQDVHRVLRSGGVIEVHVPNLDVLLQAIAERRVLDDHAELGHNQELHWMHWVAERLFHCGEDAQWHRACFNADHLHWCLTRAGFRDIQTLSGERGQTHGVINLGMGGVKRYR